MIWVHCGDKNEVATTLSLAKRLLEYGDGTDVLITACPDEMSAFGAIPNGIDIVQVPAESPAKTRAFLAEWGPKHLIWVGGPLRPILLREIEKVELPAKLINARSTSLFVGSSRWLPGATRNAVAAFARILTADGATATRLIRGGVARDIVDATGPILEEPMALPHDQNELTVQVEALSTRPMWFAAQVVPEELPHLAQAHLSASRKSHRLLLIIMPRDIESGPQVAQNLRDAGLIVGLRSEGDEPTPEHQAYVADVEGELGLWYRIAPLTFMGGTLAAGGAVSPLEPISLGSAVVHGPHKAPHITRYARLLNAEASREVRSAAELGIAVGVLMSPEQSARMALAGWSDVTQNAETINRLVIDAVEGLEMAEVPQ